MIKQIDFAQTKPFRSAAAKEGASIKDTKATVWFGYFIKGQIVGIAGLMYVKGGARIKGVFVVPAHRAEGIGSGFVDYLINVSKVAMLSSIEALAYNYEWYINNKSFRAMGKKRPNGAQMVIRAL